MNNLKYNHFLVCDYHRQDGTIIRKFKCEDGTWSEHASDRLHITTEERYNAEYAKCEKSQTLAPAHRRYYLIYDRPQH